MKLAHELGYAFNDYPANEHAAGLQKSWQVAREFYEGRPPVNQMVWKDAIESEIGRSAGRRISKSSGDGQAFDVFLRGRFIGTVYYGRSDATDFVRKDLIDNEEYNPSIVVAKGR